MRALVTGGAGFIGSHIVRRLIGAGHQVVVLDDFSSGSPDNLRPAESINNHTSGSGGRLEVVSGNIRNFETVQTVMEGIDIVFHHAALVSVPESIARPDECYGANVNGSLTVLEAARKARVNRVVLASSAAVYGESTEPVDENAAKRPISPYAASKLAMERAADIYATVYGLETVCLRYFNVYGPRQRPDSPYAAVIPTFIQAMLSGAAPYIHGDGTQLRDFVHVSDVVTANLLSAESDKVVGKTLNISSGGSVSVVHLAGILQEIIPDAPLPVYASPREGDIYFSEAVIEQAWQALGYRPEVALVEGLQSTVEWFRQERLQTPP